MKSNSSISLLMCALLITIGSLNVLRVAARSPEASVIGAPRLETEPGNNPSPSVSGNWQVSWAAANGNQRQVSMQIKQDASKLSGTFQGERGSASLKGKLEGNQVSFTVKLPRRQLSFTGTVDGDKMSGTTEQGASWTATRQ